MSKAIYILGGMGPQASQEFYRLMMEKAQTEYGAKNNEDFPEIVLHSVPVPDFISNELEKERALEMLKQRMKAVSDDSYGSFAIVCNTAHLLAPQLQEMTRVPFVSMVGEVAATMAEKGIKKVGLLASPTTIKSNLYQFALKRHNVSLVVPSPDDLGEIEIAIRAVIANKRLEVHRENLTTISEKMIAQGAGVVILGCTELPIILDDTKDKRFLSSTGCLAQKLLGSYYKSPLRSVEKPSTFHGANDGT